MSGFWRFRCPPVAWFGSTWERLICPRVFGTIKKAIAQARKLRLLATLCERFIATIGRCVYPGITVGEGAIAFSSSKEASHSVLTQSRDKYS
ncbi:MAG: hypothetical protein F6J98_09840 [Moorea sp. SIO4G2]|nr:hypothetical protein [Moorena sp. SIO4G2]